MEQFDGKIWDSIDGAVTRDLQTVSSLSSELFYATLSFSEQAKLSDAKNDGILERLIDGEHLKALDYKTERNDDCIGGQFNVRMAVALRRKQYVVSRIIEDLAHARNQNCPLEWTAATSTVLEQGMCINIPHSFTQLIITQQHISNVLRHLFERLLTVTHSSKSIYELF
jgi:hypothetical protein